MEVTEINQSKPTRKNAKNPEANSVEDLNYKEPNRCSITGQSEKEAGILFSIDHIKISPDALTLLNAQLARYRATQRQS